MYICSMNWHWEPGTGKLTVNVSALLLGLAALSPLLPFFWFVAPLIGESRLKLFAVLILEGAAVLAMATSRRKIKAQVDKRRHESYVSAVLRRAPV